MRLVDVLLVGGSILVGLMVITSSDYAMKRRIRKALRWRQTIEMKQVCIIQSKHSHMFVLMKKRWEPVCLNSKPPIYHFPRFP